PRLRLRDDLRAEFELLALELVVRLDQPLIRDDLEPESIRPRLRRLLGPLQGRGKQRGDRMPGELLRGSGRHLVTEFRQVVTRDAPIEDAVRVVNLTVADEVDEGGRHPSSLGNRLPAFRLGW